MGIAKINSHQHLKAPIHMWKCQAKNVSTQLVETKQFQTQQNHQDVTKRTWVPNTFSSQYDQAFLKRNGDLKLPCSKRNFLFQTNILGCMLDSMLDVSVVEISSPDSTGTAEFPDDSSLRGGRVDSWKWCCPKMCQGVATWVVQEWQNDHWFANSYSSLR